MSDEPLDDHEGDGKGPTLTGEGKGPTSLPTDPGDSVVTENTGKGPTVIVPDSTAS